VTEFLCGASMSCIVAAATALCFAMKRAQILVGIILVDLVVLNMGHLRCILVRPMAINKVHGRAAHGALHVWICNENDTQ
jgi:ABC-type transport system involved in cytochrome c biogenesis permease component